MKVSVLVPIWGIEKYVKKCAESLFSQNIDDVEFIFVNDCTPDNSIGVLLSVVDKYPLIKKNIHIIDHPYNKGLAAARRTALSHAIGEYILHIDGDDYLEPNTIKILYDLAESNCADYLIYGIKHKYNNGYCIEEISPEFDTKDEYIRLLLERKTSVNLCSKFIKRELCIKEDTLPIEGVNFGEDFATTPRIAYYANKILNVKLSLYNYTHTSNVSYMNTISRKSIDSMVQALGVIIAFFDNKSDSYKLIVNNSIAINKIIMLTICKSDDIQYTHRVISLRYPITVSGLYKYLIYFDRLQFLFIFKIYRSLKKIIHKIRY